MAKYFSEQEIDDLTDCYAYLGQFEDMILRTNNVKMFRFLPDIAKKRLSIAEMLGWNKECKAIICSDIENYEMKNKEISNN